MFPNVVAILLVPVALSALAGMGSPARQTADEIVARNLAAKGGVERLKALTTARITASISGKGRDVRLTVWSKRPNLMRREVVDGNQKIINGFDGSALWVEDPRLGGQPQRITGPQAELASQEAEFDNVFVDYRQKGHTVELVGTETLDSRSVHHLKLTRRNGRVQHHYIDAETALEVRVVTSLDQGGMKAEFATDFSDHRDVEGLKVPFTMVQSVNGTPGQRVTLERVEFNVPVDDAMFQVPRS
ncbi:MAG TPA: hypothetical protein VD833_24100 [Vicinamibacterales bacterium]|nr:hypothetical protein [Vicinamibacterales bacterium]